MKQGKGVVIAVVIIALILIILGISLFSQKGAKQPLNETAPSEGATGPQEYTIEITSSGFSPKTLDIKKGDTVTFINKGSSNSWPASVIHPTHLAYPGSDINKCGTEEEVNIFDACRELGNGETYSFTFNEIGSWSYHNHLNPSKTGTIIVS